LTLPTPLPVGPVNAYLLPGPPVTLVDAGPKTPSAWEALLAGLRAYGLAPADVRRIVLTHGHPDHFGQAAALAGISGAEVLAHSADGPKYTADRSVADHVLEALRLAGVPQAFGPAVLDALRQSRKLFDPLTAFTPLADGAALPCGGGTLQVVHTPGHSAGHIALVADGALIAGDVLLEETSANPLVEFTPEGRRVRTLPLLLTSLRRLAALPAETVFPGHGPPFRDPAARATALVDHHVRRAEEVARVLAAAGPQTAFALAQRLFPGTDALHVVLAVAEVMGHLDLLVADGRVVEAASSDGATIYRAGARERTARGDVEDDGAREGRSCP
jgi:glyoxylase-like metal-dependent hydrolase (beta-lactamase superfamily II)